MKIREADANDVTQLALLMKHLGYPTTSEEMQKRFHNIEDNGYQTFVALYEDRVIGMIGLVKAYYYEMNGAYVRILALVVDPNYRNQGVGKQLVDTAEKWSKNIGASLIALNSGKRSERTAAHRFYKNYGFAEKSIGFVKSLT